MERLTQATKMIAFGFLFLLCLTLFLRQIAKPTIAVTLPNADQAQPLTVSVVLTPTKDNTLFESVDGTLSNGVGSFMYVGKTNSGGIRRGLMMFDIAGTVPAGATIVSASLQLQLERTTGGIAELSLHRLLADWGEGASDSTERGGGGGAPATPDDATWLHRQYDETNWQTPGGDFMPTATVTDTAGGTGPVNWPSSPAVVAEVQGWLDEPQTNFGWILIGDESQNKTAKSFATRERNVPLHRPQLFIVYEVTPTVAGQIYLPFIQK